jgi:hypothetical protein
MARKGKGKEKEVSASEKEYKKLSKKVEKEIKQVQGKGDFDVTKGTDISNSKGKRSKSRKAPKEKEIKVSKSITDMTREDLIKAATSTAQHSNKTLRDYEKADKEHFDTHGRLLAIAEKFDLKTRGNRVSRSFNKLSDNQLRDFITEAKQTYTGKSIKKVSSEFDRRRAITTDMIQNRFKDEGIDVSKLNKLSDSDFAELYGKLNAARASEVKAYNSNEVILNFLKEFSLVNDIDEDEMALRFQQQREAIDLLNRNKAVKSRNRGRRR